jgi:hypothetical protein
MLNDSLTVHFYPQSAGMIIILKSFNQLIFVMEMVCVLFEVRTECLNTASYLVDVNLCSGCETWTMTSKSEEILDAFERKILRRIYGPKKEDGG